MNRFEFGEESALGLSRSVEREKLINCKVSRGTICIAFCIAFFIGIPLVLVFFRLILHTDSQANSHYHINLLVVRIGLHFMLQICPQSRYCQVRKVGR
jgi:hypothetical protein